MAEKEEVVDRILSIFNKVQIWLFCYIDNYIFLCYSLLVSSFFLFQISKSAQVDICDFRGIPAYLPH